jgi:hypothetical protein
MMIQHFDKSKGKLPNRNILGVKKDKVSDMEKSDVSHISAFVKDELSKLEAKTNFSEEFSQLDAYQNFSTSNPVLVRTLEKIDSKQAPNAKKLADMVLGLSHDPAIVQKSKDFGVICDTIQIDAKSIMSKPSAQLQTTKEKIEAFADKFKILRIVDEYSLMSYRDNHKKNQTLCAELVMERDAQLASIV